ncbi:MAG: class I SAM-dependent methyltransferase [Candidatus Dactylopiibacterium sp.]|nr:class I SAM-dependent methyltransferase [Candidatus Dactylopiibacterium sp.]
MPAHLVKALLAQAAAFLALYSIGQSGLLAALPLIALAALQGVLAAAFATLLRSARWWVLIHLAFCPALVIARTAGLPGWIYGLAFAGLAGVYWSTFRTQVPLFLSNHVTVHRLAASLPVRASQRVLDVGSGTGSFVRRLARLRPQWQIRGIETAPVPYLVSSLRTRGQANVRMQREDFWQHDLSGYDIVYAFLSPVPMRMLWRKALREMRAGTLLVSNTFEVPGVEPERIIQVDDKRHTRLYCYRVTPRTGGRHADTAQKSTSV